MSVYEVCRRGGRIKVERGARRAQISLWREVEAPQLRYLGIIAEAEVVQRINYLSRRRERAPKDVCGASPDGLLCWNLSARAQGPMHSTSVSL